MIDVALLAGRIALLALLYLFLYATVRAGMGNVLARGSKSGMFLLTIEEGPRPLKGTSLPVGTPIVIGRSPGADICIADDFVSGRHARVSPTGDGLAIEDLGSTNGTLHNGRPVSAPESLAPGDTISIGAVRIRVERR